MCKQKEERKDPPIRPVQKYRRKIRPTASIYQPMPVQNSPVPPEHLYGLPQTQRFERIISFELFSLTYYITYFFPRNKSEMHPESATYHEVIKSETSMAYTPSTFQLSYGGKDTLSVISQRRQPHIPSDRRYDKNLMSNYSPQHRSKYTPSRISPYHRPSSSLRKGINISSPQQIDKVNRPGRPFHIYSKESSSSSYTIQSKMYSNPISSGKNN